MCFSETYKCYLTQKRYNSEFRGGKKKLKDNQIQSQLHSSQTIANRAYDSRVYIHVKGTPIQTVNITSWGSGIHNTIHNLKHATPSNNPSTKVGTDLVSPAFGLHHCFGNFLRDHHIHYPAPAYLKIQQTISN